MVIMVDGRSGGLNNIIFKNLKVDCALSQTQRNSTSDPGKNYGVYVTDTSQPNSRVLFDSVQITACWMGLHSKGTSDLTIKNSNIHDNGGFHPTPTTSISGECQGRTYRTALSVHTGNGINISYSDNITVQRCILTNNHFRGVRAANSSSIDVLNNTVSGNGDTGIIMNSETAGINNFRIINNTVTSNAVGISTTSNSSNGSVWRNEVFGNGTDLRIASSSTSVK